VGFLFLFSLQEAQGFSGALGANLAILASRLQKFFVRDFCEVEFWEVLQMKKVLGF